MKIKKIILIIIFSILTGSKVFSAAMFDPQLEWKSIKTEHFWIHYHQGIKEQAIKLSVIAEKVHNRLSPITQWNPALRTDVVLVDNLYTANGFSTPIPFNRVQIYLTRPEIDGVLCNFDNWLEMVFTHEYTHTLNMDMASGFPAILRYGLGRCCLLFPNIFLPYWTLEGNAVYQESDYSKFGRNNSTYTDMIIRTEILNNNFKSISEASTFPRTWPTGNVPYLYGGLFVDYLEKKYGKDSFANIFIYNSNKFIPYQENTLNTLPFIKNMSEWIYNKTYWDLWDEWEEYLKVKYNRQIANISKHPLTNYKKITDSGFITSIPRFSRNGKTIYFIRNTNYNKTALMSYLPETGRTKTMCRVNDPNSISVSNGGRIFLSDAEFYRSYSIFNEAFVYTDEYRKLTSKLKASYIDISPDDKKACYIKQDKSKFSLIISDISFDSQDIIINNSDIQMAFTKFSPDGKKIVFTLKDQNGNADIAIINIQTKEIKRISNDEYNDINPAWHPDGERIVFSSDRDGVYNLYEYNLKNAKLAKLSNIVGGAFSPDISPDGRTIVFTSYDRDGFDIATMEYPDALLKPVNMRSVNISVKYFTASEGKTDVDIDVKSSDFTIFNSVFPSFWLPQYATDEVYDGKTQSLVGFYTFGMDTLYKNIYLLSCYVLTYEKRANIDISYYFGYLYPDIILQYHDDSLFWGEDEFPWENDNKNNLKRKLERSGTAAVALPLYYYQSYHVFTIAYKYLREITDLYYSPNTTERYTDTEAKIRLKYIYSNAAEYAYSVSKEDGRDLNITADFYRKQLGSDLAYSNVFGEYAEYWPGIWRNNVIMTRIRGGTSFGNPDYKAPYNLGRLEKGETGTVKTDEDEFGMRGYPFGRFTGNRIAVGAIEYRLPVIQIDLGAATFPLMFRDLWFTPFFEYGNVWKDETNRKEFKSSAGIELNMRITIGYSLNLQGYIGFARGFNKYGEDQIYFAISTLFEGALKNNYKWLDYL